MLLSMITFYFGLLSVTYFFKRKATLSVQLLNFDWKMVTTVKGPSKWPSALLGLYKTFLL